MNHSKGQVTPPAFWWQSLSDEIECAITLEPVNALPYPPITLDKMVGNSHNNDDHDDDDVYYFDGRALASYIVSRGIFQNPLTREKLTYDDCRRLDEYLDQYKGGGGGGQQRFGVLEAFALRETVQVRGSAGSNNAHENPALEESRQRRADYLRSEATAALSGLFDYQTQQRQRNNRATQSPSSSGTSATYRNHASTNGTPQSQSLPALGFDLHRPNPNNNQQDDDDDGYGMVVVDDDDALRVESEQREYQELQDAFPRLSTQQNDTLENDASQSQQQNEAMLQHIRQQAQEDQLQQLVRQQAMEHAKRQLEREARQRKEQRQQAKHQARMEASRVYQQQQEEQAEIARARAEIEQWRKAQWEKMRRQAQQQQDAQRALEVKQEAKRQEVQTQQQAVQEQQKEQEKQALEEQQAMDKEAKQKAAKAAKRKRAKDRKKQQKAQEREEQERRDQQAALQAQKEASAKKCAHCGGGIIGAGFEKFGHQYCSPKCARAGPAS